MRILAINPGSTSTKFGVFDDEQLVMHTTINHPYSEMVSYRDELEQLPIRKDFIKKTLKEYGMPLQFDVIVGRGGLTKPIASGVYEINEAVIRDTKVPMYHHVCNLGSLIAYDMAQEIPDCKALMSDPGVVDELDDIARVTGIPEIKRLSFWHALNQKAIARRYAREHGKRYEELDLIVCHLGSGISITAHHHGRAVDSNNALNGDGPFTPQRSGSLPVAQLVELCYSGKYTRSEMLKYVSSQGGLLALLGTINVPEIIDNIQKGDRHAEFIMDAMIYNTSKYIASLTPVFYGHVDAIVLTGAMANSDYVTSRIKKRVSFIAPVSVYPGEDELTALAMNALSVMRGQEPMKVYE